MKHGTKIMAAKSAGKKMDFIRFLPSTPEKGVSGPG
jgi:hypothetical protein